MRFDDLTPYCYNPNWDRPGAVNVGWLGDHVPTVKRADALFLRKLALRCCNPINAMRGYHICEICGKNPMEDNDQFFLENGRHLGNGEIWITASSGRIFVSPTMIYHYICDNDYSPPDEFVTAVIGQ